MSMRKPYSRDVPDEQWVLVEPVITAWKAAHPSVSGHQGRYAMREIVNAILNQNRSGCQWDLLPHDLLRWQLREKNRRLADPSLIVMDTQSIRADGGVPADTTGKDASKRVPGRKRCLAVDVSGLVVEAVVLPASAHDNAAGIALLDGVAAQMDTVKRALVDQGFKKSVIDHGKNLGIDVESLSATRPIPASSRRPSGGSWNGPRHRNPAG
ncbi:transposase [Streptomyces sp. NPDC005349]|uniref:transposase n=1 Tax=Streptomyces sp. NPDC005349 TaxID=3157037 RepID=UPI0033B331FF